MGLAIKIVFTFSHGQTRDESCLNDCSALKQNQENDAVVAKRFFKIYLKANSLLPHTVTINQKLGGVLDPHGDDLDVKEQVQKTEKYKEENEELLQLQNEIVASYIQCNKLKENRKSCVDNVVRVEKQNQEHDWSKGMHLSTKVKRNLCF